jgi:hypothetical protein
VGKTGNCVVTPQATWHVAKSLMKINGSKAPTDIHRPLYLKYHQKE